MALRAEFTKDKNVIGPVLSALKDCIGDENSPSVEQIDWEFLFSQPDLFIAIYDEDKIGGIVWWMQEGHTLWELHMNMLPTCRGEKADWAYKQGLQMLKETNKDVERIQAVIPCQYVYAHKFCERHGWGFIGNDGRQKTYELKVG